MKTTRTENPAPFVGACIRCSGTGTLFGGACFLCDGDCVRLYGATESGARADVIREVAALLKGFEIIAGDSVLAARPKTCKKAIVRGVFRAIRRVGAADIDVFDRAVSALAKTRKLNLAVVAGFRAEIVGAEVSCAA